MNTADTHDPGNAAGTHNATRAWGGAAVLLAAAAAAAWGLGAPTLAAGGLALLAAFAAGGLLAARRPGHSATGASGALLRGAWDADAEGCFITAADGTVVYANPALRRLIPNLGTDALSVAHIAAAFADDTLSRLAADGEGVAEARLEGTDEWRRVSVQPFDGGTLWRVEDVTQRRRRDEARRRQEATIADYLDNLPAGFFAADGAGRLLYANRTLAGWLGVDAESLCGGPTRFADFVISFAKSPSAAADGAGPDGAVTLRSTGGEAFEAVVVRSLGADDGGRYSRSVVLREDRGGGEAALRRLRWLFDEAPVGIVLADLGGTVRDCNRAFLKLLGRHRDGVVGRPVADLLAKEDRSDLSAQLSKVVMGTTRGVHLEVRLPGAGGRELAASLHAGAVADGGGDISGLALHFIDTTEHKNLETQFAQSQKIQAVGQLAGGVAHDFNNLLTAMIGFSDLLLERHGPEDPSYPDIMQIRRNADRATDLVRQLLAFSRNQTLEPVELDVAEALADLSNLLGRLLGETVELRLEPGRNLGMVMVDPGQFDQTVINLAVNARDAMPRGGTLTIRTSNVAVDAPIQRGAEVIAVGDYVLIEISDTGVGIAKENMDHIFEPFFSTKEVGRGTGLGLSTVYGIVRQTGGTIFVSSAAGEGTTFAIYLPRHFAPETEGAEDGTRPILPPPPPAHREAPVSVGDLSGSGTVLLVEDEEAVRAFGARALRNRGYTVLEAENGEGALDVINADDGGPIQLIISDVVMPGMDGHTLIKLVRHELPDVKVILMSGYAEDAISEEIHRDSSVHFLPKPFTLKALAGKVKEVMEE